LIDLTKKFGFDTVFLSNSGAEAVENAIKICYDYRGEGHGITFKGAFHGRTLGALSLNRSRDVYRKGFPAIPGVLDLPYCSCRDACDCGWVTWKDGDKKTALEQILETICPDEISYIILEPVQGEGGYNIPNKDFMSKIGEIKEKYGIPLISDEVQTGLGRTGKFWAIEHFGVEPDVITAAKGLRVGATISSKEIFPKEKSRISSTWGAGDIINSAIACKTLDIIKKKKLVKNAARMGKYFLDELASLQDEYEIITDVRGLGLMDAIEFETKEQRDRAELECFRNGLLTLLCGYKTLRFLPPLDVRKREIDLAIEILDDVLKNI
jgi:4-aminobutyrate aminotransferase